MNRIKLNEIDEINGVKVKVDFSGKSTAIYLRDDVKKVCFKFLEAIKKLKDEVNVSTIRLCLHESKESSVHEMIIFHSVDGEHTCHKHLTLSESYHIIEGELEVYKYDDDFKVLEVSTLSSNDKDFLLFEKIPANIWHLTLPKSKLVIFKETRGGPFNPLDTILRDS